MTRLSTPFVRDRELIIVEAEVVGRAGRTTDARLVLDTGAVATTLTPNVIHAIGYSRRDAFPKLTTANWKCDEAEGWEMASLAGYVLGTDAVYRAPFDHQRWFMLLSNLRLSN